ncbi:MAG: hypothetical protein COT73_00850 [Bdellovibrio sp. CG10_big_fil_rev_8_21_14_0_10_47_8]|nr:MAG: hypothetical protein COT73_00850 [Bdellovibrio sp. CG10_big_fil_rev_8_21_14_0_10_47_8]
MIGLSFGFQSLSRYDFQMRKSLLLIVALWGFQFQAQALTWSENEPLPQMGENNPYHLSEEQVLSGVRQGRLHALHYPVKVTGTVIPYEPLRKIMDRYFGGLEALGRRMGLHSYPETEGQGPYFVPFKDGVWSSEQMGLTRLNTKYGDGLTFSCAACHSANLFGRRVLGMSNRFPRANDLFLKGKKVLRLLDSHLFQAVSGASRDEISMYLETKENLRSVEPKKPQSLGLDTSLAHVALSLSHRRLDDWATKDSQQAKHPRAEILRSSVGDSKPAVWWNVKYKNKWLLDGSVVSGNPIYTNILWNEIGRGTDLHELKNWLDENPQVIQDLTTAVYQSEPPLITDFFDQSHFDLSSMKRGQTLFQNHCAKCHGQYQKAWDHAGADKLPWQEQFKTLSLQYFTQTPVINIGTDDHRRKAMSSLVQLNELEISKEMGIFIKEQPGYVPPPLLGIWARYPYLHNNSVASLCDLLTPSAKRPKFYLAREANDTGEDFDFSCNGYPVVSRPNSAQRRSEFYFDTRREGLSNQGHDQMLLNAQGQEIFSAANKKDLIRFLQTL